MKWILFLLMLLANAMLYGQQVNTHIKAPNAQIGADGNFIYIATQRDGSVVKTDKTYTDQTHKSYSVFRTKKGKLFVWKTSKKTGKEYKYYLILPK